MFREILGYLKHQALKQPGTSGEAAWHETLFVNSAA